MIIDLGPLTIKLDVLVVQIINVAILFYIFKKLFGDTLIEEIAKRREMTLKLEQADKEYALLIAEANAKKDAILTEALAHKKSLVAEAEGIAQQKKEEMLSKAATEAKILLDKAARDAEAQKQDMVKGFEQGVKRSALLMVKKLFSGNKNISDTYVTGLVDEFSVSYKL